MKSFAPMLLAATFFAALMFAPSPIVSNAHAQAAGVALTNPDAGVNYFVSIGQQKTVNIQCREPACIRLVADTAAASVQTDCTKDMQVPGVVASGSLPDSAGALRGARLTIETGGLRVVVARTPDAGNPGCVSQIVTRNNP